MVLSFAVTSATYFYSYESTSALGLAMANYVYRGWPWAWSVEQIVWGNFLGAHVPTLDFQALNFLIDLVLWMTIFLLPSSLYLCRKKLRARVSMGSFSLPTRSGQP
jgi:hypothetical protein